METPPAPSRERYQALLGEAAQIRGISLWKDAWRRLKKNWAAMGSLWFLCVLGLLAFFTPLLPLQSPQHQISDAEHKYQPPNLTPAHLSKGSIETHWNKPGLVTRLMLRARLATFGTWSVPSLCGRDELGRDVLARIFWGARVSIIVGLVATLVSLAIGVSYGAVSGYLGGVVDTVLMRIVDILYSIPFIFIVIFLLTILSEDSIKARLARLGIDQIVIFYFVIGAIYWLTMARVVRGQIISLKHEQFVDAARTIGAGTPRIVFRHLIPNVLGIVIVYLTLTIPSVMLFEAFLSFLGLGVQPPDVSWGLLMSEGLKVITPLEIHWWLVVFPGLALALTLFALNFLGDGLRDALDPRMKNR
ncbi:MAG: ABC transporter permease [Pirellulaceae bacterium]